jgi:hypothetical protein
MKCDLRFAKRLLACLLFGVSFAGLTASAQSVEQYFISAKAGGLNLISGKVSVRRKGEMDWVALASKIDAAAETKKSKSQVVTMEMLEKIDSGDTVRTEDTGRLEVLLNPGSYLRLAENSELEMIDSSLDSLRLKLNRGTAIVEATGKSGGPLMTELITPHTTVSIVKTGLYRVNVLANNTTEVLVRKGRAMVGTGTLATLKDGKKIVVGGAAAAGASNIAGFDKKVQDSFDFWSKKRAESLIAVNGSLPDAALSNAILNAGYRPLRSSAGLWIYDPIFGGHTFFPLYNGWHSPYGFNYVGGFGYSYDYYRPYPIYNTSGGGGGSGNSSGNRPNTPANPGTPSNPDNRGRNVRERKNMEGDVLPIRPVESNAQGQRPHRGDGGGGSPSYRQPNEGNYGNRSSSETYRQNTQPAPARQEPARREPTYSAPSRMERPAGGGERIGPRGKNLEQRR